MATATAPDTILFGAHPDGSPSISPRSVVITTPDGGLDSVNDLTIPKISFQDDDNSGLSRVNNDTRSTSFGAPVYQGRYSLIPSALILEPILRTVLEVDPSVAPRVWDAVLNDVLVNQLAFEKEGAVYSSRDGQSPRLVLAPVGNHEYMFLCPDQEAADRFILFLRAHDILVKKVVGEYA